MGRHSGNLRGIAAAVSAFLVSAAIEHDVPPVWRILYLNTAAAQLDDPAADLNHALLADVQQ